MPSIHRAQRSDNHPVVSLLAIVAMVLALVAAVGVGRAAAAGSGCHPYPDVDSSNSACANIAWLKTMDITKPADGRYHPTADVNRGSMAAFLFRLTHPGKPSPKCTSKPFPDVSTGNVFCGYIRWAKTHGIAFGYANGDYGPNNAVTRGAMAAYLHRIATGKPASECTDQPFKDVKTTDTFCGVITWMKEEHLSYGVGGDKYGTALPVTRQAMASFLHRTVRNRVFGTGPAATGPVRGRHVTVSGSGFFPGENVAITLHSTVRTLGNTVADSNGNVHATVSLPTGSTGRHSISLTGQRSGHVDTTRITIPSPPDRTPPGRVTHVKATTASDSSIRLSWTNPTGGGFAGVVIRRAKGSTPPATPTSGRKVADTTGSTHSVTDTGLAADTTYSYALFAHDTVPNYAAAATGHATTSTGSHLAAISGTVTAAHSGAPLAGVTVIVFGARPRGIPAIATTDAGGAYSIGGVVPGEHNVCFAAGSASASHTSSRSGYASECYKNTPWVSWSPRSVPFNRPPTGATPVFFAAGKTNTINASLDPGGVISGTVTAASSGQGLADVTVVVSVPDGVQAFLNTDTAGAYEIDGLTRATYTVCFDGQHASGGSSPSGYASECFKNTPWEPGGDSMNGFLGMPSAARPVAVTAGKVTTINAALEDGGTVTGTVSAAEGGAALSDVLVTVFDTYGAAVGSAFTENDGTYSVSDLASGPYTLCVNATTVRSGYASQCYDNVPWDPAYGHPPLTATSVAVNARSTTHVDISLPAH